MYSYAINKYIDLLNLHAGKFFNLILDAVHKVICYSRNGNSVRYNNMKIQSNQVLFINLYINPMCETLFFEKLNQSILHAYGSHSDNTEALYGGCSRKHCYNLRVYHNSS